MGSVPEIHSDITISLASEVIGNAELDESFCLQGVSQIPTSSSRRSGIS